MSKRFNDHNDLATPIQALLKLSPYIEKSSVESHLFHLIEYRVSQINGCALCLAMHAKQLLDDGERIDRLSVMTAWRESGWFTEREQAALALAEAVTTLGEDGVPDDVFDAARAQFSESEVAELVLGIIVINGWNRLNVTFQNEPTAFTMEEAVAVH